MIEFLTLTGTFGVASNAVLVGLLVVFLEWQELMLLETWDEYLELALGPWPERRASQRD